MFMLLCGPSGRCVHFGVHSPWSEHWKRDQIYDETAECCNGDKDASRKEQNSERSEQKQDDFHDTQQCVQNHISYASRVHMELCILLGGLERKNNPWQVSKHREKDPSILYQQTKRVLAGCLGTCSRQHIHLRWDESDVGSHGRRRWRVSRKKCTRKFAFVIELLDSKWVRGVN